MSIFSSINQDEVILESIFQEISDLMESGMNTDSIINSYMLESNTVVLESSIVDSVKTVIAKLVQFIVNLYEKFISLFMTQTDYIKYILDKHKDRINNLTDEDLKTIAYEYRQFNIPKNIPVFGYFGNVQKYIDKLSSFVISFQDIEDFKYMFSEELALIRGKIIGKNEKITDYNFIGQVRGIFRGSNEVYIKHMTKSDLDKIVDGIWSYKDAKTMVETSKESLVKEYSNYAKVINNLMQVKYNDDALSGVITNKDGEKKSVDIVTVNKHKTYQSLVVSFISHIAESYSIVFKEKLQAVKDKYDMEMSILSQVLHLV